MAMATSRDLEEASSADGQDGRRASMASRQSNLFEPRREPDHSLSPVDRPDNDGLPQHAPTSTSCVEHPGLHPSAPPGGREARISRRASAASNTVTDYDVPDTYANLDETIDIPPVQNPYEEPIHRFRSLEQVRSLEREQALQRRRSAAAGIPPEREKPEKPKFAVSRLATQLYTISYLILFSILGTLARLGLQALTTYPGTPIIFPSIWPNFTGSLVMGFLSEDRMLFREEHAAHHPPENNRTDEETSSTSADPPSPAAAAKQAHAALKKTIPLYIGLATGFCGSLTSFSAFMRDAFLALSNDLPITTTSAPTNPIPSRNPGYSLPAVLAVLLTTTCLSLSALFLGAHLAIALAPFTPSLPPRTTAARAALDRLAVPLAWGCWLGAAALSLWPPGGRTSWRGDATLALVFAPLGCLARFYASLQLNGRWLAGFPLGTFAVNVAGTAVLAAAWDLARVVRVGRGGVGVVACQVLTGVQDGFCGCLTTVSTWVAELAALRRRHAYVYGGGSVLAGLAVVVAVMGGLRWSGGYEGGVCK
ncbi:hypothetical protein VTK56DRAFT_6897 [Thermocarpiscus australiensis]